MGLGKWSRYGRGSCEGYALEFGHIIRCDVRPGVGSDGTPSSQWFVSVNGVSYGEHATFDAAIAEANSVASQKMAHAIEHWESFKLQKPARRMSGIRR